MLLLSLVAAFAADVGEACAPCHRELVTAYRATPMARALGRPSWPDGTVQHAPSRTRFSIEGDTQAVFAPGLPVQRFAVEWAVGSGAHAMGSIVRRGSGLFLSPLSFYTEAKRWGLAPGFEKAAAAEFTRPVTLECLACHSGRARPIAGSLNLYEQPSVEEAGIGCERCHGEATAHLRQPSRTNVVQPARLSAERRDAVCEQCHLGGAVRVLNLGKSWLDFRAGQRLEETWTVYTGEADPFHVASHAEQLAKSRCAVESGGALWCGTCHRVHAQTDYRAACLGCHSGNAHAREAADCGGCHMPKRRSWDSGLASFTDHRIARKPDAARESAPLRLKAWREPAPEWRRRNLALAQIAIGERRQDLALLQQGFVGLTSSGRRLDDDPEALAGAALVLLLKDRPREAALALEKAHSLRPRYAPDLRSAAKAWRAAGEPARARRAEARAAELEARGY